MLDELQEDITFLSFSAILNDQTPLHQEYLNEFYKDDFESNNANYVSIKRKMIPRRKIRAYIARALQNPSDVSKTVDSLNAVGDFYSGYIHAVSPCIMDMYYGEPAKFYVRGLVGTERHYEHRNDLWNYFYRGINALSYVLKVFKVEELLTDLNKFIAKIESTPRAYR